MPSRDEHLAQAAKNRKLAETLAKTEFLDWAVTIYFYVTVHIIESYLAIHGYHSTNHDERRDYISRIPQLRNVIKEYLALERVSRQARYYAQPITPEHLRIAEENLAKIEAQVAYITTGKKKL
ncbi:MAG TPA: hypothetical protein VG759_13575 [Candidatus Angelobacter sp.]|nr:hypothetical protein [Candidatus Angelobacter sp.]